jgi:Lipopolysaccharide kinase (Kdo/WaaP) family
MAEALRIERAGWRLDLYVGDDPEWRDALIEAARAAIEGEILKPVRRSRHATTYRIRLANRSGAGGKQVVFIKLFDPSRALAIPKRLVRGSRARRAVAGSFQARAAGFAVPEILVIGEQGWRGRTLLMTEKIEGDVLPRFFERADLKTRRETLRVLGREVGRMHGAGLIHGDLTPFNIFVRRGEPIALVFIDHERTRRAARLGGRRGELRNLVQLGHFPFARISRTDQMRVFRAWATARGLGNGRAIRGSAWRMLGRRVARDLERFGLTAVQRSSFTGST